MSIAIIQLDRSKVAALKKYSRMLEAKIRILRDEDDLGENLMIKLIEEGLGSGIVPEETIKSDFKKYGVDL
ncbi:MAG: hypothetical protein FVQ77_14340 [Cytophagales bacterium]|nr:hypothetical protein [Cytophagales bacterium]